MPIALKDGQFELDGLVFGYGTDVLVSTLDPGDPAERDEDAENPTGNGVFMGHDRLGSQTWTFDLATDCKDMRSAQSAARKFAGVWRRAKRLRPGETMTLRYRAVGCETFRVVGRPRKFAGPSGDALMRLGNGKMAAEFVLSEPVTFDDEEDSLHLGLVTDPGGTLTWPITFPITFGATPGQRQGIVNVAGEAETPFRAVISGPITGKAVSPVIKGRGWRIELPGLEVHYDETVEIDTRARTVSKNGVSVVHFLSRRSDLSARLMPGSQELVFTTTDPTNTAAARMYWRAAHWSL